MLRFVFWAIVLAVGVLMLNGTLPIPGIADEEVVYTTPPPVSTCGPSGCIVVYTLEVANVGRSPQDSVRVRLREDAITTPMIAPTVRRASETALAPPATDRPGVEAFPLGAIAPEERVALVFALRTASREAAPGWDRVLVGVDPARGGARPGEVSAVTPGRVVHAVGRLTVRLTEAVRRAIASS
jgi:hypothetical protein